MNDEKNLFAIWAQENVGKLHGKINDSNIKNRIEIDKDKELFLKNIEVSALNVQGPWKGKKGFSLQELGVNLDVFTGNKKEGCSEKINAGESKAQIVVNHNHLVKVEKKEKTETELEKSTFLWAMADAKPLKKGGRAVIPSRKQKRTITEEKKFGLLLEDSLEFSLLNGDEYIEGAVNGLDSSIMERLRMGEFGPEAHLDMHGLNSLQAFEAMRDFIKNSWFKGMRTVLLVPGRGLNSPHGRGILRQKIREWLPHDPFKRVVLAFCTAQPRDGGPGSIYVLLRQNRKKGRIRWETLPPDPDLYFF